MCRLAWEFGVCYFKFWIIKERSWRQICVCTDCPISSLSVCGKCCVSLCYTLFTLNKFWISKNNQLHFYQYGIEISCFVGLGMFIHIITFIFVLLLFTQSNGTKRQTWGNSVDLDQMLQNAASDLDLDCLTLIQQFLDPSTSSKMGFFFFVKF